MPIALLSGGSIEVPAKMAWPTEAVFTVYLVDSATEAAVFVFSPPFSGTLSKVGFLTQTVNTGALMDVRLETLTATGTPTGTLFQSSSNALVTVKDTDDNVFVLVTLGSGTVVTAGTDLACVITHATTTSIGSLNIVATWRNRLGSPQFPYSIQRTTIWVRTAGPSNLYIEYTNGATGWCGEVPIRTLTDVSFTSATNPDEIGNRITVPFPMQATGIWSTVEHGTGGAYELRLYDADTTTVLDLWTNPSAHEASLLNTNFDLYATFSASVLLNAGSVYTVAARATSSVSLGLVELTASSPALMNMWSCGSGVYKVSRQDTGGWVLDTSSRTGLGLLITGFDSGGGTSTTTTRDIGAGVWGF